MAIISPFSLRTPTFSFRRPQRRGVSPLGRNVTLGRECLELSIPQLAAATGGVVSVRTISALESGRLSDLRTAELIALADALEVWPHELCTELQHYYA